jgi:hydroxymethylbilane synthase
VRVTGIQDIDLFEDSILFIRQVNMASEAATTLPPVKIGTRKSWPDRQYEIHAMSTMGDNNQTTALHEFNAKALWTHELEALLDKGELDLIVHSLKGIPCAHSSICN